MRSLALITGGAQRIGAAMVETLCTQGWDVAVHYSQSAHKAEALRKKWPQQLAVFQANLSVETEAKTLLLKAQTHFNCHVDLLINNAAQFKRDEWDTDDIDLWTQHMSTNLRAPFLLAQSFAHQGTKGLIVNMLDQRVLNTTPHFISYSLSKSALWTLTQQLALALAPKVRVNAIAPGFTLPSPEQSIEHFNKKAEEQPLKRSVSCEEISAALLYLISAPSVTGAIIPIDAGQHLGWRT